MRLTAWSCCGVLAVVVLASSGCLRRGAKGDTAELGETIEGVIEADGPMWDEDMPAAYFKVHGKGGERLVAEARFRGEQTGNLPILPSMILLHGAEPVADSSAEEDLRGTYLDALLPEDGEYTLVVHLAGRTGPYSVKLQRDAELPTSRAGAFYLAHADQHHAWFVDLRSLKRQGDLATFDFIEVKSEEEELAGRPVHSIRYTDELNCSENTVRATRAVARIVRMGGRHELVELPLSEARASWTKVSRHGRLRDVVCEAKPPAGTLNWTDLEVAIKAFENAKTRNDDEGQDELGWDPENGDRVIAIGETVHGALKERGQRYANVWPFDAYRFQVKPDERFEVDIAANFRPYLRLRSGGQVIESTFDAMANGVAAPLGRDVEVLSAAEVVVEVTSFEDPRDAAYTLTVRRLPSGPAFGGLRIRSVDFRRVLAETEEGRAAAREYEERTAATLEAIREAEEDLVQRRFGSWDRMPWEPEPSPEQQEAFHRMLLESMRLQLPEIEAEVLGPMRARVQAVAKELALRDNLDLVVFKGDDVLGGRAVEDVTPEVIRKLNAGGGK